MFRRSGSGPITVGAALVVLAIVVVVPKFAPRAVTPYATWSDYSSGAGNIADKANGSSDEQSPSPVKDAGNWFVILGSGWMHFIVGLALLTVISYVARWYLLNGRADPNALIENDAWVQSQMREVADNESLSEPQPMPSGNSQVAPDAVRTGPATDIGQL
jgi:hypothetical protein